jgi:NAD-dependent SIR2 family protein deacetylase
MVAVPKPPFFTSVKPSAEPFILISFSLCLQKDEKRLIIHEIESLNRELNIKKVISIHGNLHAVFQITPDNHLE